MRIERSRRLVSEANHRVADAYASAKVLGLSSDELSKRVSDAHGVVSKCPKWSREHVLGFAKALRSRLYYDLVFFSEFENGKITTGWKERSDYFERLGYSPLEFYLRSIKNGHLWSGRDDVRVYSSGYSLRLIPDGSDSPFDEPVYFVFTASSHGTGRSLLSGGLYFDAAVHLAAQHSYAPVSKPYTAEGTPHEYAFLLCERKEDVV